MVLDPAESRNLAGFQESNVVRTLMCLDCWIVGLLTQESKILNKIPLLFAGRTTQESNNPTIQACQRTTLLDC